jgi:xanthine dehydrogenase molybdenum-binding subunit
MVPHAFLRRLDIAAAKALPGVAAVLTADDIPGEHNHGLVVYDWPVMVGVGERIRYVGDALALVAAETQDIADRAAALIQAEFDEQPVVIDPVQARQSDAPQLHAKGNLLKHIKVRKGDMARGFAESDVILEHTFHTPMMEHAFLEPECSIAVPTADGRLEIYVASQIPYQDRTWRPGARMDGERIRLSGSSWGAALAARRTLRGKSMPRCWQMPRAGPSSFCLTATRACWCIQNATPHKSALSSAPRRRAGCKQWKRSSMATRALTHHLAIR